MAVTAGTVPGLSTEAVEALTGAIRGSVVAGEGAGGIVRPTYNAMHTATPALTVVASGTADVVDAVNFARDQGLTLAIRGGGHSIAGLSTVDGGLLLDLSLMDGVHVDPERRLATVQGGALIGDVDRETQRFGLVAPSGVVSDTGVGGITLGGGYGWLRRKYGLAVDSLVEAQVVCADGSIRTASETVNPDLFWALRGGGGNFGVVTSFTFALSELGPEVAFSAVLYPLEDLRQILGGWRDFMKDAPNEITSVVVTMTFPANPDLPPETHDRPVTIVGAVHTGGVEEGLAATKPLRELAEPIFDMSGPTPFVGVQTGFDPLFPRQELRNYWKAFYAEELTDEALDLISARGLDRPSGRTMVNTFAMGGAINEVDPEATAFSARTADWLVSLDGVWSDAADDQKVIGWIRDAFDEMNAAFGNNEVYLNFTGRLDEGAEAGVDSAFGRNLLRLREIKAKYDPDNFFRVNQNITPA